MSFLNYRYNTLIPETNGSKVSLALIITHLLCGKTAKRKVVKTHLQSSSREVRSYRLCTFGCQALKTLDSSLRVGRDKGAQPQQRH